MNTTATALHRNGTTSAPRADLHLDLLSRVRIATPCPARWEDMTGDDRVRHCALCNLNVHNLSAMSRAEAEALLSGHFEADGTARGERFCAQVARRADGTIITRDCPVGLARARERMRRAAARVAAAIGLLTVVHGVAAWAERRVSSVPMALRLSSLEPVASLARWMRPASPPAVPGGVAILGDTLIRGEVYTPPRPVPVPASGGGR